MFLQLKHTDRMVPVNAADVEGYYSINHYRRMGRAEKTRKRLRRDSLPAKIQTQDLRNMEKEEPTGLFDRKVQFALFN